MQINRDRIAKLCARRLLLGIYILDINEQIYIEAYFSNCIGARGSSNSMHYVAVTPPPSPWLINRMKVMMSRLQTLFTRALGK